MRENRNPAHQTLAAIACARSDRDWLAYSALVWDIAIGKEASNINAQGSKELRVERAVQVVLYILQTISLHTPRHVGGNNLDLFTGDVV